MILPTMRKYSTNSIGKLLRDKKDEMGLFHLLSQYRELDRIWGEFSDGVLRRAPIERLIRSDKVLEIICGSSATFAYLIQRRKQIEEGLATFMQQYGITQLIIKKK